MIALGVDLSLNIEKMNFQTGFILKFNFTVENQNLEEGFYFKLLACLFCVTL